jgi:hypothetical protein
LGEAGEVRPRKFLVWASAETGEAVLGFVGGFYEGGSAGVPTSMRCFRAFSKGPPRAQSRMTSGKLFAIVLGAVVLLSSRKLL